APAPGEQHDVVLRVGGLAGIEGDVRSGGRRAFHRPSRGGRARRRRLVYDRAGEVDPDLGLRILDDSQDRAIQRTRVVCPVDPYVERRGVRAGVAGGRTADLASEHLVATLPAAGVARGGRGERPDAGGVHERHVGSARTRRRDVLELDAGESPEAVEREVVDVVEAVRHADGTRPTRAGSPGELRDALGLRRPSVAVAGDLHGPADLALAGAPEDRGREGRRTGAPRLAGDTDRLLAGSVGGGDLAGLRIEVAAISREVLPGALRVAIVAARRQLGDAGARALDAVRDALPCHLLEVALDPRLAVLAEIVRRGD